MTIRLNLSPEVELRMQTQAAAHGMPLEAYVQSVVEKLAGSPEADDSTLTLIAQWEAEDATDDPKEIAARIHDWEEIEAGLQANGFSLRVPRT